MPLLTATNTFGLVKRRRNSTLLQNHFPNENVIIGVGFCKMDTLPISQPTRKHRQSYRHADPRQQRPQVAQVYAAPGNGH